VIFGIHYIFGFYLGQWLSIEAAGDL